MNTNPVNNYSNTQINNIIITVEPPTEVEQSSNEALVSNIDNTTSLDDASNTSSHYLPIASRHEYPIDLYNIYKNFQLNLFTISDYDFDLLAPMIKNVDIDCYSPEYCDLPLEILESRLALLVNAENVTLTNFPLENIPSFPKCTHLEINRGPNLKKIASQPKCKSLKLLKVNISTLPKVPECEDIFLAGCNRIKTMPALPTVKNISINSCLSLKEIEDCDQCEQLDLYNLPILSIIKGASSAKQIDINSCESLEYLPSFLACEKLFLNSCNQLKKPPELPTCKSFKIHACSNLTYLPALDSCKKVKVYLCNGITSFPELPLCEKIIVKNCDNLTNLPKIMPSCRNATISNNPKLKYVPTDIFTQGSVCVIDCPLSNSEYNDLFVSSGSPLFFDPSLLQKTPEGILHQLSYLKNIEELPRLRLSTSIDTVDATGVRSFFVTELFKNLVQTDDKSLQLIHKMDKEWHLPTIPINSDPQVKNLKMMGKLLAFAYKDFSCIGHRFDMALFNAMEMILNSMSQAEIRALDAAKIWEEDCKLSLKLLAKLNKSYSWVEKVSAKLNASDKQDRDTLIRAYSILYWELPDQHPIKSDLPEEFDIANVIKFFNEDKERFVNLFQEAFNSKFQQSTHVEEKLRLIAGLALIQGFSSVLSQEGQDEEKKITATELFAQIQGTPITKEGVIKALEFEGITIEDTASLSRENELQNRIDTKAYLIDWIQRASIEDLTDLVEGITGKVALKPKTSIRVDFHAGDNQTVTTNTCFNLIHLPSDCFSQERFDEKINLFVANQNYDPNLFGQI